MRRGHYESYNGVKNGQNATRLTKTQEVGTSTKTEIFTKFTKPSIQNTGPKNTMDGPPTKLSFGGKSSCELIKTR